MKEEFDALFAEHQKLLGELQAMRAVAKPEQEPWRESASDYERGVIDGRQMQMQSSVDKAVNRLAQSEQEPVLVECGNCHEGLADMEHVCKKCLGAGWVNNPQPKEPEQEPVAWYIREKDSVTTDGCWAEKNLDICEPLYTTPPQRTWVDLTDDEMLMIYGQDHEGKKYNLGRMVQQSLKEKNT